MRLSSRHGIPAGLPITSRVLLLLPLGLAGFVLMVHLTEHDLIPVMDRDVADFFSEQELIRRADGLPRLEKQLGSRTGRGGAARQQRYHHKIPQDLGGEGWAREGMMQNDTLLTSPKIAFVSTTSESVELIQVWMAYHRILGVSRFYLFTEGQTSSDENISALNRVPGATVIPYNEELESKHAHSHVWNETWLSAFFYKPCNNELFVRQSLNMMISIEMARADGIDWLLHIDTDELLYPGGTSSFSLQELLGNVPQNVDIVIFPNYEALPEHANVEDPFTEVSLFKRNYAHVESSAFFESYASVSRGNPNYFITYGNGKSAARVVDGLRSNGAHRWNNYDRVPIEWQSEQGAVLHYTYNRFQDLISRRDRCDCEPTEEDAARCFLLAFDRVAFIQASLRTDEQLLEFYKERLVWDDVSQVVKLIKKGLFSRLYEPQLIIRGLKEAKRSGHDVVVGDHLPLGQPPSRRRQS